MQREKVGEMIMNEYVEVINDESGEVEWRTGPMSFFRADKVAAGREINLNHEKFSVRVIKSDKPLETFSVIICGYISANCHTEVSMKK